MFDCVTEVEDYEFAKEIPQGSFTVADQYHNQKTSCPLAVELFHRFSKACHDWESLFVREIENLLQVNHPSIVSLT
jgi:hypothetical protein